MRRGRYYHRVDAWIGEQFSIVLVGPGVGVLLRPRRGTISLHIAHRDQNRGRGIGQTLRRVGRAHAARADQTETDLGVGRDGATKDARRKDRGREQRRGRALLDHVASGQHHLCPSCAARRCVASDKFRRGIRVERLCKLLSSVRGPPDTISQHQRLVSLECVPRVLRRESRLEPGQFLIGDPIAGKVRIAWMFENDQRHLALPALPRAAGPGPRRIGVFIIRVCLHFRFATGGARVQPAVEVGAAPRVLRRRRVLRIEGPGRSSARRRRPCVRGDRHALEHDGVWSSHIQMLSNT